MQIRRATPADAGAIAAIHVVSSRTAYKDLLPEEVHQAFTVERRERTWRDIITSGDGDVWIAEEGDRALGWICVGASRDSDATPTTAELRAMYIEPASWRRGIGRALWAHAEAFLAAGRYSCVTLWVFQDNARALTFYRQLGFTDDPGHTLTRDRGGVQLVEVRLRRELASS